MLWWKAVSQRGAFAILPTVTRGETFDEAVFVSCKAINIGMATVTARPFNAAGCKQRPSKISWVAEWSIILPLPPFLS